MDIVAKKKRATQKNKAIQKIAFYTNCIASVCDLIYSLLIIIQIKGYKMKAISFRLPEKLINELKRFSKKNNQTMTDIVSDGIRNNLSRISIDREKESNHFKNPTETLIIIITKIRFSQINKKYTLDYIDLEFLISLCAGSYSECKGGINDEYFKILMDISFDLIIHFEDKSISYDKYYTHKYLNIDENDIKNSIHAFKKSLPTPMHSSTAEWLLRPLHSRALGIYDLNNDTIERIFNTDRLASLIPIFVYNKNIHKQEIKHNFHRDINLKTKTLNIDDINIDIQIRSLSYTKFDMQINAMLKYGKIISVFSTETILNFLRYSAHKDKLLISDSWHDFRNHELRISSTKKQKEFILCVNQLHIHVEKQSLFDFFNQINEYATYEEIDTFQLVKCLHGDI